MRRDYVEPDDFEYEPTAHDEVLKRAQAHQAASGAAAQQAAVAGQPIVGQPNTGQQGSGAGA